MPVTSSATPIGVTSNSWKVDIGATPSGSAWFEVRIRSLSRISGLEPTMVMVPPRMAQKPIGISSRDMGSLVRAEMRLTTGRNSAAAPTFCMNDEITPTVPEISGMMRVSVLPPMRMIKAATRDMMPVLSSPAPMIMTAMIEITALDANPSNRCSTGTKPVSSPIQGANRLLRPSNTMMVTAATSTPTISNANKKMVSTKTPMTQAISTDGTTPASQMASTAQLAAAISRVDNPLLNNVPIWLPSSPARSPACGACR